MRDCSTVNKGSARVFCEAQITEAVVLACNCLVDSIEAMGSAFSSLYSIDDATCYYGHSSRIHEPDRTIGV